ncbi:unnamed protein product [Parnassius apollo]|uniref:(apollo) hypothetical protein n=1 Tax=Parnassius apollo TaxID=110799 RepID=A0A8S3XFV1_PARAO|nr:unnamed protein product [Parnassius apollo]
MVEFIQSETNTVLKFDSHERRYIMGKNGVMALIKDFYYDPFKWSVVKSVGFFTVGIVIASECTGLEVMPAVPQ